MGIHTGAPLAAPPKYVGLDVHEAARIMAAGHGGQVLLSAATEHLLDRTTQLLDLGEHRLKDLSEPQPLYQLRVAGTSEEFPALKTLGNRPTNLPTVATPFIGRATELVDLRTMLHREGPRIVTVTGPGGVGKTRIALQAAADSLDQFRDGVYWVPFAAIRDSDLALGAIAATLGLREDAGEPVIATVARHLERKELLLVADNLEHILDAGLGLARLLEASPRVRMLVTSREPLRITGESVYDLPPLALPAADSDPTAEVVDAVDLFVTRAQSTDSTFTLTKENSADIAEIVRRLDGLPLAIELAAARIRALLPAALLRRLSNRLQVLTAGSRDAVERQCTLEATIAWSYDLLTPDEARLFARLSVFIGGFRIEAVDAVAADDASRSAFDEVASLLDKSLVRRRVDPDNEPRYWLLETIRDYAAERLRERGDQLQLQIGHAYFFADLAEAQDRALTDDDLEMRLQLIDADLPNFRAAAGWAEANNEATLLLRLGRALAHYATFRGNGREILQWLSTGLAASSSAVEATLRTRALQWAADFAREQGDLVKARSYAEEAVASSEQLQDHGLLMRSLHDLGEVAAAEGNDEAEALYERAIGVASEAGLPAASSIMNLGLFALARGDYARARTLMLQGLEMCRENQRVDGEAIALTNLGSIAFAEGNYRDAIASYADSLEIALRIGFAGILADGLLHLAAIAARGDSPTDALIILAAAETRLARASITLDATDRQTYETTRELLDARVEHERRAAARQTGAALSDADAAAQALAAATAT